MRHLRHSRFPLVYILASYCFSYYHHPTECELWFDFSLPRILKIPSSFSCISGPFLYLFFKDVYWMLLYIFKTLAYLLINFQVVGVFYGFYKLDFYQASASYIFLPVCELSFDFALWIYFNEVQSISTSVSCTKHLKILMSKPSSQIPSMLLVMVSAVWALTFTSLIYFGLLVYGMNEGSNSLLHVYHVSFPSISAPLVEKK